MLDFFRPLKCLGFNHINLIQVRAGALKMQRERTGQECAQSGDVCKQSIEL